MPPRTAGSLPPIRRALVVLAALLVCATLPAGALANDAISQAEWDVLAGIDRLRARHGLAPLRMASSVRRVAGARSASMARLDYFGHVSPAGTDAGDMLRARGIRHETWGEVIGWTVGMRPGPSARWIVDWWRRSRPHRALLLSRRFDRAGVGAVRNGGRILWTVVLVG